MILKIANLLLTVGFFLVAVTGCKDDDTIPVKPETPSISIEAQEHMITGGVVQVSVIQESTLTVDYSISAPGLVKRLALFIDGVEEIIEDANGQEAYSGEVVVVLPYDDKTISIEFEVTDEHDQVATGAISIVIEAAGEFSIGGDIQIAGNVRQGEELVISGSGFGSGPNIVIYDDFEGGDHNDPIPLNSPLIGSWTEMSESYIARYHDYAYSGQTAFSMQDDLATVALYGAKPAKMKVRFDDTQEVFLSYQLAVPPGKFFPGAPTREEWGTASHWKMTWLMDTDNGFGHEDGRADLCVPTNGQAKGLQVSGNTDKIGWVGDLDDLFDIDGFNRVAVWLRADPALPETAGYTWIQWLSAKTVPAFTREHIKPVFNAEVTSPTSYQWNQLNVPGWYGNNLTNPGGVYDDVYLATGANAAARVEIGDAPVYEDCKELSIMPSVSWTDSEIKVIVKAKGEETISQKYLFIFNSNNELIADAIAIP